MKHVQNQFRYFLLPVLLLVLAEALLAQPANDNCAGAILLTSSTTCNLTNGSNVNATLSANDCNGGNNSNDDVWYRFVASSTSHTITVGSSTLDMVLDLRSGACNGTTVECVNEQGVGVAESQEYTNLTIGATYYIRVFTLGPNTGAFTICVTHPPAPANDNCAGAITLTPSTNCSNTAGTTVGATNSIAACGGFGSADHDVWYRFVATATGHRIIGSSSILDLVLNPRSGACNGGGMGCFNAAGVGGTETVDLTGLTVGTAYFVRVYTMESGTGGAFNICVANIPAPSNDECAGAISLNSSTSCATSSGSTLGATQSITACGAGSADDDVWYKFTAVTYSHTITVASTSLDMVVQTFSGACPGTPISCVNATGDGGTESAVMTGLTPGVTYYVRLYSVETGTPGTFTICVTHASGSPNDDCSNAILLTSQTTCVTTTATSGGATQSLPACGSGSNADDDVWFKFVAISSSHTVRVTAEGFATEVDVRSGACNGTSIACASTPFLINNISTVTVTPSGLIPGNTYYFRVYNEAAGSGTFDICITHPTPPGNDDCAGATTLTSAGTCTTTAGSTVNATQSLPACGSGTADDDVWYKFVATVTSHVVTVSSTGLDIVFDVRSGACNGTSIACVNATGSGGTETTTLTSLTIGSTYYVRVYSVQASGGGSFNICVTGLTNDNCSSAILLTPSMSCVNTAGTTLGATQSLPDCSGGNTSDDDVWYRFVATATGHVVTASSASLDLAIDVRSGACNGSSMACVNATGAGGTETTTVYGLTVGTTYYIRVYSAQTSGGGTFNICVTVAGPINDNCTGATLLTSSTTCVTTSGTTVAATQSLPDCSGGNNSDDDVWYRFVAVSINHQITVSSTLNMVVDARSGACDGTSLICQNVAGAGVDEVVNLTGLTVGATYYIRVFSLSASNTGTFNICVTHTAPPANDNCTGAILLNSSTSCVTTSGTTVGATQSLPDCSGGNNSDDDVWYRFVAASPNHQVTVSSTLNVAVDVRSGACDGTSLICQSISGAGVDEVVNLTGLTVGATYYIRVFTLSASSTGTFTICVKTLAANDECTSAITVTSNNTCVPVTGSTIGATQSMTQCAVTTANDVWYQFVAVSTSHTITVSSATLDLILNFRGNTGSCPGNSGGCINNTGVGGTETTTVTALVVGATYYVRVFSSDPAVNGSFSLCVTHPPANDECVGAFSLTSNTSCVNTTGSTAGATQSLSACAVTTANDVWYQFVAVSPSHTITVSSATLNLILDVRNGSASCPGSSSGCVNNTGVGGTETTSFANLAVGTTYYVRVLNEDPNVAGSFTVCVTHVPIPANNDCAGAFTITPGTGCTNTTGSTVAATQSLPDCSGGNTSDDDVWYKFVATAASHTVRVGAQGPLLDLVFDVRTGACNGTSLVCQNNAGPGGTELYTLTGLTVGATYYVRVFSADNSRGSFDICVSTPPANDECAGALSVTSNTSCVTTSGSTAGATQSLAACGTGNSDDDVWYKFTAVYSTQTVTVSSTALNLVLNVRGGTGTCPGNDLACVNATGTGGTETSTLTNLTVGATYYVRVYSFENSVSGSFTICVTHPAAPANNECAGAITLTSSPTCTVTNGTTLGANESLPACVGTGSADDDVWYKFVAVASAHTVTVSSAAFDAVINVRSGTCNGTDLGCFNATTSGVETASLTGLTAGDTYLVRIYSQAANTTGAFTVCVTHALPANDECTGAVNLTPTAGTFADPGVQTNEAATQTTAGVNCPGSISVSNVVQDVWYRFTTNASGGTVNISATPLNGTGNPLIHFFAGCNTGPVSCNDQGGPGATETLTIVGVGASSTYYFRVYGQNSPSFPFTVELTGSAITGPLPLELSLFSGQIDGNSNVLQWETRTEKNVEWHLVERSVDAVKWTEIGRRTGQVDSQQPMRYTFEDVAPLPRSYYRLRSVDFDGQESYSNTLVLTREKELFGVVAAYPSPASDWITVQLFTRQEETVELRVIDVSGRLVQVQHLDALAGGNELKMAVQHLQSGVYLLQAHNGRDASTPLRFVKQ